MRSNLRRRGLFFVPPVIAHVSPLPQIPPACRGVVKRRRVIPDPDRQSRIRKQSDLSRRSNARAEPKRSAGWKTEALQIRLAPGFAWGHKNAIADGDSTLRHSTFLSSTFVPIHRGSLFPIPQLCAFHFDF